MLGAGELSVNHIWMTRGQLIYIEGTISKPQVICCEKDSVLLAVLYLQAVKRNSSLVASLAPSSLQ